MPFDFDDMEVAEQPLNKKNITDEITGEPFDFDKIDSDEPYQKPDETGPHPLVGIMDMMIASSVQPLKHHGYPAPNTAIWEEWGKPNLSKAFYAYIPMEEGGGVDSPAFAGILGLGALVIAFLPVIMHHVDKKKQEALAEEEELRKQLEFTQAEEIAQNEDVIGDEKTHQVEAQRSASEAPVINPKNADAWNRIRGIIAEQK